ncbi:sigma-70 family RNA polymerase sigma factor [Sedimentibacter hydroxybenzoicus DSM 7310]|uniref:Sigma-70 family RNA polymerase sigma factor n=1 Tax=Sedimentibacter hydroxybenzoicus DSM 7310 TaxID=1123245 RepID=A0A974BL83_SEDHY|nr:sigma-70 family RNA polymerase sigma factor [Sedimentibacter hydroxybenzoicus]NYB75274.1 sigma-70 family RNA polymerase sigma factor [Sedimentibacter hydroxybenzoicus DSM 7310]
MKISEKEFEALFKQYKNDIYRIAYTYVNNEADALDIVQESAYQAYISKDKIRDKDKFKSWILKIAVNKSKDLLRKNKLISLEDLSNVITMQAEDKESMNIFMDNLKSLSMDEKNVIVLKVYFEYTFEMISDNLKIPESTVKSKYYRALEKLKIEEGLV